MSIAIPAVYLAWIPATALLFRAVGPRRGSLIALFSGLLLLPRDLYEPFSLGPFSINKRVVGGLALLAGVLVSDPGRLFRARPSWLDLPMISFVLLPLASLAAGGFERTWKSIDYVSAHAFEWGMPYLIGRLYFADREGPLRIARAVAIAGLLTVPICVFEIVVGPRWYVARLVYGLAPNEGMIFRMGGFRPVGFMTNALEVPTWLALAATMSTWLWLRGAWKPRLAPAWAPPVVLILATIACRGVYGDAVLGAGLILAVVTHYARLPFAAMALLLVPPAYIVARGTGSWDGEPLTRLAAAAGRAGTVTYRFGAEDAYLKKLAEHGPVFGYGGLDSGLFDYWSRSHLTTDSWWLNEILQGGIVGLAAFLLALFIVPAGLGLCLPAGRSRGSSPGAMAWGLALVVVLHALDNIHNMALLTPTPLIGGSLVGLFLARRGSRPDVGYPPSAEARRGDTSRLTPVMATALALLALEILGGLPRPDPPRPTPGDAGPASSGN